VVTGLPASNEILSPLVLSSPSSSKIVQNLINAGSQPASPLSARKPSVDKLSSQLGRGPLTNGNGKQLDIDLKDRAIAFSRRNILVKECFSRWRTRFTERLAWAEACRRSDAYSRKVHRERVSHSPTPEKKRRAHSPEHPLRKRARRPASSEYKKPYTDEELAQRFKAVSGSYIFLRG
jgi:hypothetical protein